MKDWVVYFERIGFGDVLNSIGEIKHIDNKRKFIIIATDKTYEEINAIDGVTRAVKRLDTKNKKDS